MRDKKRAPNPARRTLFHKASNPSAIDTDYGPMSRQADIDGDMLLQQIDKLFEELQVTPSKQAEIEFNTRAQSDSDEWHNMRRLRITASNAHKVFKLQDATNNKTTLDVLLYPKNLDHLPALRYGRKNEHNAILKYEEMYGVQVTRCGLFISLDNGVLAASPDGLVGNEGLLEVKCPIVLDGKDPDDYAKVCGKSPFIKRSKAGEVYQIVKSHPYYYQMIMTLYVTGRKWCDLVVWSSGPKVFDQLSDTLICKEPLGMAIIIRINRDFNTDSLFKSMTTKLLKFWRHDLAPEIVDPRKLNKRPFRQPEYRLKAIAEKEKKKSNKEILRVQNTSSSSAKPEAATSSSSTRLQFKPPPTYDSDESD
jgi:hypothetical protein